MDNFKITLHDLPVFKNTPQRGTHFGKTIFHQDFEFVKDSETYILNTKIYLKFKYYFKSETRDHPEEQDIEVIKFGVNVVDGYKYDENDEETYLTQADLWELETYLKQQIEFV